MRATASKSFDAVSDIFGGGVEDPYPIYATMRRECPVMEGDIQAQYGVASQASDPTGRRPVYTLFKHNDIRTVLLDPATFTSGIMMDKLGKFVGSTFLPALDGEEHKTTRTLLQATFTQGAVERWKPTLIRPLAEQPDRPGQGGRRGHRCLRSSPGVLRPRHADRRRAPSGRGWRRGFDQQPASRQCRRTDAG
jgi:cytochrome P450